MTAELQRLAENQSLDQPWSRWGSYLSDRQWGTVREDYSGDGNAWNYLPHDQARSRAYRWGEDGLGGFCDCKGQLCFALAFGNGNNSGWYTVPSQLPVAERPLKAKDS